MGRLNRAWRQLPVDGQGLLAQDDPALGPLRNWAVALFWQRVPRWSRPFLVPLTRLAWGLAALLRVRRFARRQKLERSQARQLAEDCLRSGAQPVEAFIWRSVFSSPKCHPLPARAAGTLLSRLGSPEEHRLLADKLATAELLSGAGLATPPLRDAIPRGGSIDPTASTWATEGHLFVKPRHGSASRGTIAIDALPGSVWRIDGDLSLVGPEMLESLIAAAAATDSLLVQARLDPGPELADLATAGPAPVLRLNAARHRGGAPFLHSALLTIDVPGEHRRHFIRGQIRAPVDPTNGEMTSGVWFLRPADRYARLPWNEARVAGRPLLGFHEAVAMVLRAMELVPNLPLVNWDLILTAQGPVILEGNTGGDWILTSLAAVAGLETLPLAPMLREWT